MLSRRRFLAVSGAGSLALALGGVGLALQGTVHREPAGPLLALTGRSFSILAAIADRICPGGDGLPTAGELEVAEGVDLFLSTAHPGLAADLQQGLLLIENGLPGLFLDGHPRPFTARSAASQDAALEGMRTSRIALRRTLYKALVGLVTATYWGHPATRAHTGYTPPDFSGLLP